MRKLLPLLLPVLGFGASPLLEIESVIDLARNAPAEAGADALIRVAALDQVPRKRKIELLEQAFELASEAPQPYKRRSGLSRTIGPSGFLNRAYQQDLDADSLQLRAVEGLLPLDSLKARQRFQEIIPLQLPPLTCDDFLVYDVDRFYRVLGRVASQSFTGKELRDGEPAKFLARYLARISSPVEVAPAAQMLGTAALTDAEFQSLVTAFAGTLGQISGDDRSFTYAAGQAGAAIQELAEIEKKRQTSPGVLLEAYRRFLVNHLAGTRCADGEAAGPAIFFNEKLQAPPLQPIDESESKPSKVEGKAKGLEWGQSPECESIRDQYRTLMTKENGEVYQPRERAQDQWQARVRDFLSALAAWTQSSGATAAEHFREKIGFYNDVFAMVPDGPTRDFVLRSLVSFLSQSRLPPENRLEWWLPVSQLVGRVALDPLGAAHLAEDLRSTNDPSITLYLALEVLAPRPAGQIMLLL